MLIAQVLQQKKQIIKETLINKIWY